jgi:predicted acyl esterase
MNKLYTLLFLAISLNVFAQPNNNGKLDNPEELATKFTIPFVMPDGIKLMTDVFLPIVQDCLRVNVNIPNVGNADLEIIKKGTQIVIYDTLNGQPNPNPYQLPLIFTRTPYGKKGAESAGAVVALLGYAYAMQDMRGRYTSEGVYIPMFSDSWSKTPYHPDHSHVADVLPLTDPRNANKHEDGYFSVKYITDSLKRNYGSLPHTNDFMCNGSVGMFGASALGNTQLQAAAAHRIDPSKPGLKSLLPIVATNEHYNYTGFQNGVFREKIVTGWLKGQILDLEDEYISIDNSLDNDIHTAADYNLPNKFQVAQKAIDHFTNYRYFGGIPGYYPNSKGRAEMDCSRAPVDANGEGDANGQYSRYTNMQVPAFHVTGWWDIFIDGQIETFKYMKKYSSDSLKKIQKIIIGPWAHQTIATRTTGDMTYPESAIEITKFDPEDVSGGELPLNEILESELITWFRYTLNNNNFKTVGEPKFIIPESQDWQSVSALFEVRIPSKDYKMTFIQLMNYLNGTSGLKSLPVELRDKVTGSTFLFTTDVPATGTPLMPGLKPEPISEVNVHDFANSVPPVRFYVCGPNGDSIPENANAGNYWFSAETFPVDNLVVKKKMYFHKGGAFNYSSPSVNEGYDVFVHDPDDPIKTVGGANMIVKNPNGDGRDSQGQMNLADPTLSPFTMDRAGVLKYETEILQDTFSIIGFPIANIVAKTNPAGVNDGDPTDTDFFVRVVDVYPDGREFFVTEGAVNARGKEYSAKLANHMDKRTDPAYYDYFDNTPFVNIDAGKLYVFRFQIMPIAYTFGKGHKMKILISSSNHPRYQVNPNLPIEENEFFRRHPFDGLTYNFNGKTMSPRKAVQRVTFRPDYPSYIEFPVYEVPYVSTPELSGFDNSLDGIFFPNPADDVLSVYMNRSTAFNLTVFNMLGQQVTSQAFSENITLDVSRLQPGMYFISVVDSSTGEKITRKVNIR